MAKSPQLAVPGEVVVEETTACCVESSSLALVPLSGQLLVIHSPVDIYGSLEPIHPPAERVKHPLNSP